MNTNAQTPIDRLLEGLQKMEGKNGIAHARPGEAVVSVPLITSSATSFYEKMRSILDNKEQHLIRWNTIYRTLGRLVRGSSDDVFVSGELLSELVADGLLPNNAVPIKTASKIQYILLKYRVLEKRFHLPELFKIAVSEVESMLYGNRKEFFVQALYETARSTVLHSHTSKQGISYEDMGVYLACRRVFLEDDEAGLLYGVWLQYFPKWETMVDIEGQDMKHVPTILQLASQGIADPLHRNMTRKIHDLSVYFLVLKDFLDTHEDALTEDATHRERELHEVVARLSDTQHRIAREMGMRAFWYILITKTAIILPAEYVLMVVFFPPIEIVPLFINLIFHPLVLFVMMQTIRMPKKVNADMIVSGVKNLIAGSFPFSINMSTTKNIRILYLVAYFLMVVGVFSLLIFLLDYIGFTSVNIVFFVILLGIISFFTFRVRVKAKRFTLHRYRELYPDNFWFSVVTIPFIDVGRRLSNGFRAINILTEIMDLFIEVPFKTFVRVVGVVVPFLEKTVFHLLYTLFVSPVLFLRKIKRSFSSFIKERRDEIQ